MNQVKTIGVLTSGGDAPGMNAAIRAVVRASVFYGFKSVGIRKGYNGLINGEIEDMTSRSVSDIINRGGTILQTARCAEFMTLEGREKALSMAMVFGVDAIVIIGGDGSYRGARDFSKLGMNVIGIPGTIDNDIASTEYSIGFDTALNTVQDALDKLRDTAYSHERCSVLEVMGRRAGDIAIYTAIGGGAEAFLIPEKPVDMDEDVLKPIIEGRNRGKSNYIVIVTEGIGNATEIAALIQEKTGIESRATILGYIQRGGSPTVRDRVMAGRMGVKAVELIKDGIRNRIIGVKGTEIIDYDIDEALEMKKTIDEGLLAIHKVLSI